MEEARSASCEVRLGSHRLSIFISPKGTNGEGCVRMDRYGGTIPPRAELLTSCLSGIHWHQCARELERRIMTCIRAAFGGLGRY
jgi:hypothetical protein